MLKKLISIGLFLCFLPLYATHIVGGNISVIQQSPNTNYHLIRLTIFFDQLNGNSAAEDESAYVSVFEQGTDRFIETIYLSKKSNTEYLDVLNKNCQRVNIRTRIIEYQSFVYFNLRKYSSVVGYYISWERCCRNNQISNIVDAGGAGTVIKTEFPPVIQKNTFTNNSSPLFLSLNADYACVGQTYSFNFKATDLDGDSLVYSLSTPINGFTSRTKIMPILTQGGPYPLVNWQQGISLQNCIPGPQPLSINQEGLVTGIASDVGLYVYTVVCTEYRNGLKIGEVNNDFQLLITDDCSYTKPITSIKTSNNKLYSYPDTIKLFSNKENKFDILTTDAQNATINYHLYPPNINELITLFTGSKFISANDTLRSKLTWNDCKKIGIYNFAVITIKDACPFPISDSTWIILDIKSLPNSKPVIKTNFSNQILTNNKLEVKLDSLVEFNVIGTDSDTADLITLTATVSSRPINETSMVYETKSGNSKLISSYSWTPTCEDYTKNDEINLVFYIQDNSCFASNIDSLVVPIKLIPPPKIELVALYNVFTPNKDGLNDELLFPYQPADNCDERFKYIEIYNRWGGLVFKSTTRMSKWDGGDFPTGVYFYAITYTKTTYKNWVEIIR